ncbi:MAG: GMC family oxidoreductase [Pirellulales bacterium]|nr:GMC family oxidoreductase [Pirellulales bacterium]
MNLPDRPDEVLWDVLVVGTGMGGGTLGYALARAGKRVLFVERGQSYLDPVGEPLRGITPEEVANLPGLPADEHRRLLLRAGRAFDALEDDSPEKPKRFVPEIGCGVGGSTALYGMVLERLFPADFLPRANYGAADLEGSSVPESWPITYDDLRPWYAAAERLFRARGSADPLRPDAEASASLIVPPPLTPGNAMVADVLRGQGLHPYQLHLACEHTSACATCQGFLCDRDCKNDAGRMCVLPAVREHGASLITECAVRSLEASRTRVERVVCQWRDQPLVLRAKQVVLAAGALVTPTILLHSRGPHWPHGVANDHDQVGRNLMRHCIDLVVLRPKLAGPVAGQTKELALNDFYQRDGRKFGTVQSVGGLPPFLHYLGKLGPDLRWLRYLRPALGPIWAYLRVRVVVLASIMEDLPFADNRVLPADEADANRAANGAAAAPLGRLVYHHRASQQRRVKEYNALLSAAFMPLRPITLSVAHDNKTIAHVCGTCRAGDDPRTSVLDANCRAHGLENLYVADASFFPTSGGVNPSLTIAANALRVAEHLRDKLG